MEPLKEIEDVIKKTLNATAATALHDRVLARLRQAQRHHDARTPALPEPVARRIIMRSTASKLAVAATVIVAAFIGIHQFSGTSGVAWAEVAAKVQASPGVIFRVKETGSDDPNDDWPDGYTLIRRASMHSRTDWYRLGQVRRTIFFNLETKQVIWLAHDARVYYRETLSDERARSIQGGGFTDPQEVVDRFVSGKHRKLGHKTIDGTLCEGIETIDEAVLGANFPVESFVGRLWVSVETGYPVLAECEFTTGDGRHHTTTADQFQWDVDLSAGNIEPEIPSDYRLME